MLHIVAVYQGICSVLRELSAQLATLPDYVRQLYGSLLIKLAKKKLNHATMVAGESPARPCALPLLC
jgi:hypothetical protein